MWRKLILLLITSAVLAACDSPETMRRRGGGAGADVGNRDKLVEMHEGAQPFWKTPKIIPAKHPPLEPASQADERSRQ
jgi:predicted small secreted protein